MRSRAGGGTQLGGQEAKAAARRVPGLGHLPEDLPARPARIRRPPQLARPCGSVDAPPSLLPAFEAWTQVREACAEASGLPASTWPPPAPSRARLRWLPPSLRGVGQEGGRTSRPCSAARAQQGRDRGGEARAPC